MNYIIEFITSSWITISVVFLSGFLYYLFNEFEDKSIKSNWTKHHNFLNTNASWWNKWSVDLYGNTKPMVKCWYYFGVYPEYKERFAYSSTILVFLTDGEHLFQFLKNIFILLAIGVISWQFMFAFLAGRLLMSFIKESLLKWLQ